MRVVRLRVLIEPTGLDVAVGEGISGYAGEIDAVGFELEAAVFDTGAEGQVQPLAGALVDGAAGGGADGSRGRRIGLGRRLLDEDNVALEDCRLGLAGAAVRRHVVVGGLGRGRGEAGFEVVSGGGLADSGGGGFLDAGVACAGHLGQGGIGAEEASHFVSRQTRGSGRLVAALA